MWLQVLSQNLRGVLSACMWRWRRGRRLGQGLCYGRFPLSREEIDEREFRTATITMEVVHERLFIREIVSAYVGNRYAKGDGFYDGAISRLGEDQVH